MIFCFDTGSRTGWATESADGIIESGVQEFTLHRGESAGMRFRHFRLWLEKEFPLAAGDLVLFEQAHHRGGAATELAVGMTTRIMEWAAARGADYKACHSATLKRVVTGRGNADKAEMMAAVQAKLDMDYAPEDDNEADALALVIFYRAGMPEGARTKKRVIAVAERGKEAWESNGRRLGCER